MESGEVQKLPTIGSSDHISRSRDWWPSALGDEVIVGANAVVTKDVPNNSMCVGQYQIAEKKIKIPREGGEYKMLGTK